jgi:hypothetical protein
MTCWSTELALCVFCWFYVARVVDEFLKCSTKLASAAVATKRLCGAAWCNL